MDIRAGLPPDATAATIQSNPNQSRVVPVEQEWASYASNLARRVVSVESEEGLIEALQSAVCGHRPRAVSATTNIACARCDACAFTCAADEPSQRSRLPRPLEAVDQSQRLPHKVGATLRGKCVVDGHTCGCQGRGPMRTHLLTQWAWMYVPHLTCVLRGHCMQVEAVKPPIAVAVLPMKSGNWQWKLVKTGRQA